MYAGLKEYSNISLILAAETIKGNGPTEIICCILIVTGGIITLVRETDVWLIYTSSMPACYIKQCYSTINLKFAFSLAFQYFV